jgi:hypothetical protein
MLSEAELEFRHGLAATLRLIVTTPAEDSHGEHAWVLRSPRARRRSLVQLDIAVCALLSGDEIGAAAVVESAGPVGAELLGLRAAVQAQLRLEEFSEPVPTDLVRRYREALLQAVAVPAADRYVWDAAVADAEALTATLIFARLPEVRPRGPLDLLSDAVVGRSLLARRAFAAMFVADFAAFEHALTRWRGGDLGEAVRERAALAVAYVEGGTISLRDGRLRVDP